METVLIEIVNLEILIKGLRFKGISSAFKCRLSF